MAYASVRSTVLDMQDMILEQEAFSEVLNERGNTSEETFGMPIREAISPAERNNAPALRDIINELHGSKNVSGSRNISTKTPVLNA